jgi:hypothetical protein
VAAHSSVGRVVTAGAVGRSPTSGCTGRRASTLFRSFERRRAAPVNLGVGRLPIFMKTILTLTIVGLLGSCSLSETQSSTPVAVSSPRPSTTDEGLPPMSYEEMLPKVAGLSKQASIPNLKDISLSDDQTEIRLWKGFGLVYPRCFVLRIDNGNPAASFVSPKIGGNKAVFRKRDLVYINAPLNAPHSGWETLLGYLKQNGIDSSIDLAVDKRYEPYPDAEALILEMKTGSRYTMAFYVDSTVTADGKKAFAICEKLQNEFDIQLACKL